jgi:hypothetical protein
MLVARVNRDELAGSTMHDLRKRAGYLFLGFVDLGCIGAAR